jgi:hypothetical protein
MIVDMSMDIEHRCHPYIKIRKKRTCTNLRFRCLFTEGGSWSLPYEVELQMDC